jgi:hypothetical protein
VPTLYTTYEWAIQYIPNRRLTNSYILVEPKTPSDATRIQKQVEALGYRTLAKDQLPFRRRNGHIGSQRVHQCIGQTDLSVTSSDHGIGPDFQ